MIRVFNRTHIDNVLINDIAFNIFSREHKINYDINIYYINKEDDIVNNAVNIICDKNLYIHKRFDIIPYNDFFINKNKSNTPVIKKHNTIIFYFDIFAFIYFIISRDLFFVDNKWYKLPFIEYMIQWFLNTIRPENIKNTDLYKLAKPIYVLPSFDIDRINFFFFTKTILYTLYKLFKLNKKKVGMYFKTKSIYSQDPWNNIIEIQKLLKQRQLNAIFFLMIKGRDKFARRYTKKQLKQIIDLIENNIGIHLSYESGENPKLISKEIKDFMKLYQSLQYSRFHYLYTPGLEHYNVMCENGIKADFSIGFTKNNGYKKGFSNIYKIPGIKIYEIPTIAMDSAVYKERLLNGMDSLELIIQNMKKTGGLFTFIFHQSAYDTITFPGFRDILYDFFHIIEHNNMIGIDIETYIDNYENKLITNTNNGIYEIK